MSPKDWNVITHFGLALKNLRQEHGFSQSALSDISNIERKHIHRLEKGEVDPTIETVYKLADAMEISVTVIIDRMELKDVRQY